MILAGFFGDVTARSESSQVNQSMLPKRVIMIFGSTNLIGTSAKVRNSGVWNNSQRRYCCPDDAAGEAGI